MAIRRRRASGEQPTDSGLPLDGVGAVAVLDPEIPAQTTAGEKEGSAFRRLANFEITKRRVKRRELMHFSRQLAVFIKAGIPITQALESITSEMGSKRFKEVLAEVNESLKAGASFSGACDRFPEVFPEYYRGVLRSAELTGHLDDSLNQLAEYIERDLEARRKIVSAMMYPSIVVGFACIVVIVLSVVVLPKFKTFFSNLGATLPLATRMLVNTTNFLSNWWYVFVVVVIGLTIGIAAAVRTERGHELIDTVLLKSPVLGDVIHYALLERFCRVLSSLVNAGVTLPEALAVTTDATQNRVFRRGLLEARAALVRGEGLAQPLVATKLFPTTANQMFVVGESTGTLDDQLATAAVYFDRELDYKIKRFTAIFEPATILAVGVIVGFVAIALVSAMYGIFHQVKLS